MMKGTVVFGFKVQSKDLPGLTKKTTKTSR